MKLIKIVPTILILLLWFIPATSQYEVTPCSELGRPISYDPTRDLNIDILTYYLDGDGSGGGEDGCWAYHHPNGKDYVVIPDSWHQNLSALLKDLIKDTMDAITAARREYGNYGTLANHLYYLLEDPRTSAYQPHALWLVGNQCWAKTQLSSFNRLNRRESQFIMAHEIAHCFIMENVDNLADNYTDLNAWFDESVAEFMASEVYKDIDSEHANSVIFNLEGKKFTQRYKAYPLWYFYAQKNGKRAVVQLMNELTQRDSRITRLSHLRYTGFDMLYHEFLFEFHQTLIEDSSDKGMIPPKNKEDIALRQDPFDLVPEVSDPIEFDPIPSERMSLYEITVPSSHEITLYPPTGATGKLFFSLMDEDHSIPFWDAPVTIRAKCDELKVIQIMASQLTGNPIENISLLYELKEREACCDTWVAAIENPTEDDLNGDFYFDYYIESEVETSTDGEILTLPMNYYVNSNDGSMLLLSSFFMEKFGRTESGGMKADAVVWLSNGQIATYVLDKVHSQKRVITMDMNQTRGDVMGPRAINPEELLREGLRSGVRAAVLPADSPWAGNSSAYAYYREERFNPGERNFLTSYVSDDPSVVTSTMSSFGFMVGHIKDLNGQNKLLIYTRYERPNGDVIKAKLFKLEKQCASFSGEGYKKMILMGSTGAIGAMSEAEQDNLVASQVAYNAQLVNLMQDLGRCGDNESCVERVKRQILELKKEKENAIYNLPGNSELSGTSGGDFQNRERAIKERMYSLQDEIIVNQRRCKDLGDRNAACGGCMSRAYELCREQLEDLKSQLDQLECELAKLHGMGDMMEDCE